MKITAKFRAAGRRMVVAAVLMLVPSLLAGQTREKGPWWPHPIWGAGDQAGGSNWITPSKVMEAIQLVKEGKIYELGQSMSEGCRFTENEPTPS